MFLVSGRRTRRKNYPRGILKVSGILRLEETVVDRGQEDALTELRR